MHCLVNDSQDEGKQSIHTCQFSLALSTTAFAGKSNVANSNLNILRKKRLKMLLSASLTTMENLDSLTLDQKRLIIEGL